MKNRLYVKELRYTEDSAGYFNKLRDLPLPVWLDSNGSTRGRYDILCAAPGQWLSASGGVTRLDSTISSEAFAEEPLGVLTRLLSQADHESHPELPFSGGAIGYLSYDLGRCYERLPAIACNDYTLPDCIIGLYDWALVQDHKLRKSHFVCQRLDDGAQAVLNRLEDLAEADDSAKLGDFALASELSAACSYAEYSRAFDRVQDYIQAGDCYQINLSQRYSASYQGDPAALYLALRKQTSAPFSAYFGCNNIAGYGDCSIVSFSPERFLNVQGKLVATQPIKGTAPRAADPATDAASAQWLLNSEKDRAENLMIVDLLRNDIGKSCEPGSISVPQLFELQSFAAVHHLVSTVQGRLRTELHALDALRSAFPGGSITGAPKLRAMEIIEELEPYRRSVYCGSMFYAGYDGNMDSSIMIRTILCDSGQLHCWGGGGIVADSTVAAEYQEIEDKIGRLLKTLRDS